MTTLSYALLLLCFAHYAAPEDTTTPPPSDVASRELTDAGYVIRYNDQVYTYPLRTSPVVVRERPSDNTDTNSIEQREEDARRPLFYFTTYEAEGPSRDLPKGRPYIEIRKKREVKGEEVPEESKIGKLRRKRTYCGRCGHGGYKVSYVPVTYAVYPVYYGGGGGGGRGCNTCGGYGGGGYGGGGSFSYSSSSAHSASGSFGWGK